MAVRVFRNHRIHVGEAGGPAQALAVREGRILAAGTEAEVRLAVDGPVELIDLDGACVVPGMYDAHIHTATMARSYLAVDLRAARSLAEALELIRAFLPRLAAGSWLVGGRWDANRWTGPAEPTRQHLDAVCPDRPAYLATIDGHSSWANTAALRLAGIDRDTPDPVGGEIVRDADGEPTGVLREAAQNGLRLLAEASDAGELADRLLAIQEHLLSLGLTSVHDLDGEDARRAYVELHEQGRLAVRVHKGIPATALEVALAEGRRTGDGDDWLRTGPLKIFSDGSLGSHTCHVGEPFPDGGHGIAVTPVDQIRRLVRRATSAGIAVASHAIGDEAAHLVLDAYQEVAGTHALRLRIEHAQHLRPPDIARMAALGVVASMQPTHCTSDIDLVDRLLGDRMVASYAWRSVLEAGAPLAFGSDAPVEEADPFPGLHAAATRTRADGSPAGGWQPHERLSVREAFRAYTLGSAYAAGEDRDKGTLSVGKLADFVVLDTDLFDCSVDDVARTSALTTVVGGEIRWQKN